MSEWISYRMNRYQIGIMLLTAAMTYQGLSWLSPMNRGSGGHAILASMSGMSSAPGYEQGVDQIRSAQAQAQLQSQGLPRDPVIQALPMQTQIVRSSRWGRHAGRAEGARRLRHAPGLRGNGKPQASAAPELNLRDLGVSIAGISSEGSASEELERAIRLGLVPEAIVLPKKEESEVSSLMLTKPAHGQKSVQD